MNRLQELLENRKIEGLQKFDETRASFLAEMAQTDMGYFIPSRVFVGLGAVCFTLFSIVSILEAGSAKK